MSGSSGRRPAGGVSPMAANDCAYGNARTWGCPVSYWTNNGYDDPIVRFNDHSSV